MARGKQELFSPIGLSAEELHMLGEYIDYAVDAEKTVANFGTPISPHQRRVVNFVNKVIAPQLPNGCYESVDALIADLHLEKLN